MLHVLDFLKGMAILLIVAVHLNGFCSTSSYVSSIASFGSSMPHLFFIISAYLTWRTLEHKGLNSVYGFWKKRYLRLAPLLYIACLSVVFLVVMGFSNDKNITMGNVITHLFMCNGLFPQYTNTILYVEWYVAVLVIFYLLVPLLWKYVRGLKSALIGLFLSMLACAFYFYIGNHYFSEVLSNNQLLNTYYQAFCIIVNLPTFFLGILLYYLMGGGEKKNVWIYTVIGVLLLYLINIGIASIDSKVFISSKVLAFAFLIWLGIRKIPNLKVPLINYLGKQSYGIYLFHMTILKVFSKMELLKFDSTCLWFLVFIFVILLSVCLTTLSDKLILKKIVK